MINVEFSFLKDTEDQGEEGRNLTIKGARELNIWNFRFL